MRLRGPAAACERHTNVEQQAQRPGHDQAQQQRRRERARVGGRPVAVQGRLRQVALERERALRDDACAQPGNP